MFDLITWKTSNCNIHITEYLKKNMQSDNEIWSVNRIYYEKQSSLKIMQIVEKLIPDPFPKKKN